MSTGLPDSHRDLLDAQFATLATLGKGAPTFANHDRPGRRRVVVTIDPTNVFAVDMGA